MSSAAFETLAAADFEAVGIERAQAKAIATAIRRGQGDRAGKADVSRLRVDISGLRWIVGIQAGISLVTLAAVMVFAVRVSGG